MDAGNPAQNSARPARHAAGNGAAPTAGTKEPGSAIGPAAAPAVLPAALPTRADGLAALPPALRRLAEQGRERVYRRGTIFIEEGEPGGTLYFIVQGLVRCYTARSGGQEFTFGFYGPGEYMGELSLDGGARSASVIVEQTTTCRIVPREMLAACIAEDPALAFELLAKVIARARVLSARAGDLALTHAYGRLVRLLMDDALPQPDGTLRTQSRLKQSQIAAQIGCSRPLVTKMLGDLVRGDYLREEPPRCWQILRRLPSEW